MVGIARQGIAGALLGLPNVLRGYPSAEVENLSGPDYALWPAGLEPIVLGAARSSLRRTGSEEME